MKFEPTHLRLETLLQRSLENKHSLIRITGGQSLLSLSFFLSQSFSKLINNLPHLVLVEGLDQAKRFQMLTESFDPQKSVTILGEFDLSPYSGLYPNPRLCADRLNFLNQANQAKPGQIFVATAQGLGQATLPFSIFTKLSKKIRVGDEVSDQFQNQLQELGYTSTPIVEDVGQYSLRGGIIDVFTPAHAQPIRIELFGDQIETLRFFNPNDQRSLSTINSFDLVPAKEVLFLDENYESLISNLRNYWDKNDVSSSEKEETLRQFLHKNYFPGIEYYIENFYKELSFPLDYFSIELNFWVLDSLRIQQSNDQFLAELKNDFQRSENSLFRADFEKIFQPLEKVGTGLQKFRYEFSDLDFLETSEDQKFDKIEYQTVDTNDFSRLAQTSTLGSDLWIEALGKKLKDWKEDGYRIFISLKNNSQLERLSHWIERMDFLPIKLDAEDYLWDSWLSEQGRNPNLIHLIPRWIPGSLRMDEEKIIFLREEDFWGRKEKSLRPTKAAEEFHDQAKRLSFGDLKPGDLVVHIKHGIGQYDGLKMMSIGGVDSEFIQLSYKEKDKLYLPVYRVAQLQKYSGANSTAPLDKLGGTGWEKVKTKVKAALREVAHELLQLYAKRAELHRPAFVLREQDILQFDKDFPYDETDDQLRALKDIQKDMSSTKPMDRLICGDVGFGKTEIAMRACFLAVQNKKQVAVLAPTTVLTFQHFETFKKRFKNWPVEIRVLNRFVSNAEAKKTLTDLKEGRVDILIGTHRLLSKDIVFKDLGLMVVDEEQKFGVTHKEKIKKLKNSVDTLTLSATPIPRTLNMSLVGIRDLSLINTAPVDRLPTRTFICPFDSEVIRKSITSEIHRGGQVYFIHNRVQSIYGVADEIRQIVPDARIRVGHGQMEEEELEKTMLAFFNHEIDVLVCTAIVESGMDVSRANTMFIDQAQMFGLSQLYQLRGRVGRSKDRAYCYLLLPRNRKLEKDAQERLKVIQENTALGSGLRIAHYDLELRGAGNILGEEQSGHVSSVGYELYMDLLGQTLQEAKGEAPDDLEEDPEINLRVPAFIPDSYIGDIRLRLNYYKALAEIKSENDIQQIESDLQDQFGKLPEPVINLIGLMLIRRRCKDIGIKDVSAGPKNVSLLFSDKTKMKPETVIKLATRENKKYSLTPDNRLNIRMNAITWPHVYEELNYLSTLI